MRGDAQPEGCCDKRRGQKEQKMKIKGSSFSVIMTDRDAGEERLPYDVLVFTNTMLAACCFNTWVELAFLHRAIISKVLEPF